MILSERDIQKNMDEGLGYAKLFLGTQDFDSKMAAYIEGVPLLESISHPDYKKPRAAFLIGVLTDLLSQEMGNLPGYGVDANELVEIAVENYRLAASMSEDRYQSCVKAKEALARIYESPAYAHYGNGRFEEAICLRIEAAEAGLEDSQRQLVLAYLHGIGTEPCPEMALKWMNVIEDNGSALSEDLLAIKVDLMLAMLFSRPDKQPFAAAPRSPGQQGPSL